MCQTIADISQRLIELLERHGEENWSAPIRDAVSLLPIDLAEARYMFRQVYRGGMGSFSDLVLHDGEGRMLISENDEFDRLRRELYELVWHH